MSQTVVSETVATTPASITPGSQRLLSLDLFRGLTIASMVMVNNQTGGGAYSQLRHMAWNGWTFTDLVFPFFLWIVGVAMTLSTAKRVERGESKGELISHAFRRAAIIFAIGLFLNGFPNFNLATLRIPGVLQRIAICYLVATIIYLYTSPRARILCTVLLMALYTVLMHPTGYEIDTNLSDKLDRLLLEGHLYRPTRDPEGTISTLTSIATCLLGILTGDLLRTARTGIDKAKAMLGIGVALMVAGQVINIWQPINKPIWTASYVAFTAGLAMVVFGACYWLVDVSGRRGAWTKPFVIFGMNAMAVYVFHGLMGRFFGMIKIGDASLRKVVYDGLVSMLSQADASLVYSLIHVAASFLFAWFLYSRRWFLKF